MTGKQESQPGYRLSAERNRRKIAIRNSHVEAWRLGLSQAFQSADMQHLLRRCGREELRLCCWPVGSPCLPTNDSYCLFSSFFTTAPLG
jgi:hypothetical protein